MPVVRSKFTGGFLALMLVFGGLFAAGTQASATTVTYWIIQRTTQSTCNSALLAKVAEVRRQGKMVTHLQYCRYISPNLYSGSFRAVTSSITPV